MGFDVERIMDPSNLKLIHFVVIFICLEWGNGQLAWSPILIDSESQVDLWTRTPTGCPCQWRTDNEPSETDNLSCACCVKGGCQCGEVSSGRCGQCGLEQYCVNMCNITLDSRALQNSSGCAFGHIKSPAVQGPTVCTYQLRPAPGQRVELQLYRLVTVGHFNGERCVGGYIRFGERDRTIGAELCGANERYSPPAVLFSDDGATSLIFNITEYTVRSQFFAYFSFTALSNSVVGFHPRGGTRITSTDCDWMYYDYACKPSKLCSIASPGFPGIYPPNLRCRYIITANPNVKVRITFTSLLLPEGKCDTHFIALFNGEEGANGPIATICGSNKINLTIAGPKVLFEFNSGYQVPPFDYNGFAANLEFLENPPVEVTTLQTTSDPSVTQLDLPAGHSLKFSACDQVIRESNGRSGHFDTRARLYQPNCRIIFIGRATDIIQISLFNYRLKSPSCRSVIDIIDGTWHTVHHTVPDQKSILKVCSPAQRNARDVDGTFQAAEMFQSTGAHLQILLRRSGNGAHDYNDEFIDGAYMFHDEEQSGTLQPLTLCNTDHYGLSSPVYGTISGPGTEHLYWNVEGSLSCSYQFVPAVNQSVTLIIEQLDRLSSQQYCGTVCGDAGCQCKTTTTMPLEAIDHLKIISTHNGDVLNCLCGSFSIDWLPVSIRTWSPIRLIYSVPHYSWSTKGFTFKAAYQFQTDGICGQKTFTTHSGELSSNNYTDLSSVKSFYHQQCEWILDTKIDRQLYIEIHSEQSCSCLAWNITLHEYMSQEDSESHAGPILHLFCPRDKQKLFTMPWKLNTVVVRVQAMTRREPNYTVKWYSQVIKSNTRLGPPAPTANAVSTSHRIVLNVTVIIMLMITVQWVTKR